VWPTILSGKDSGRDEIVYNIEPFRGAVRQGDWKLVWITLLPGKVELYNLADDPNETKNVASEQPEIVAKLKGRIEELANQSVKPLFFGAASEAVFSGVFGPAPIPTDDGSATAEP
jgi:arylsulfatase B